MADAGGLLSARIELQTPISTFTAQLRGSKNLVHHDFSPETYETWFTIGSLLTKGVPEIQTTSLFQTNASRTLLCSQLFQPDFL